MIFCKVERDKRLETSDKRPTERDKRETERERNRETERPETGDRQEK